MRKTLLMLLAIMLSISGWSVNYTVSISTSDSGAGYVEIEIPDGDVDEETYRDTYANGDWVEFEVKKGRKITLTAVLDDEELYYFAGWSDGNTENPRTITKVTKDWDLTANFVAYPTYIISAEASPANAVDYVYTDASNYIDGGDDWVEVKEGETVYLGLGDITPGYIFDGWYDGEELMSSNYTHQVTCGKQNKTYTARFHEIPTYTIRVIADPEDGGAVDAWANGDVLDDDGEGDGEYNWDYWITVYENTQVGIWAIARTGYRFLGWFDGETQVYGPESLNQYMNFTPTESKTYTARFEKIPEYTISISTNPEGLFEEDSWGVQICDAADCDESSLLISEGSGYSLYAISTGNGLSYYLRFHHWESDKGGYYTTNNVGSLVATQDEHWTAVYEPDFNGYEQVGTTNLYYQDKGTGSIDIMGMSDNKYYQSTYATNGYYAAIKINDNSPVSLANGYEEEGVKVTTSVLQSGGMARIVYRVTNNGTNDATVSLGTHADVQIGNNDEAPIEAIRDDNDNVIGIVMRDGEGGQLYVIFGLGAAGSTLIDDYWFGLFYRNGSNDEIVGNYTYSEKDDIKDFGTSYYMVENGSYDSGMGWCWKNRTIAAGQTVQYSFMIGIGEVKMEPSASVELTPVDMDSWNNVSATHTMYAEGIYTHTSGFDGYLEYQVETTDAGKWITLATDPARLQSDADFHGTFDATFDASKSVHTIHFRTRDVMGNITALPSKQFEDLKDYVVEGEIVDKTYNGSAQTQDVFLPGIEAGKYTIRYTNNINAGEANVRLAGQFPHTIGYKNYTFTILPKELTGTIALNTNYFVYDGSEHRPGWHIEGYNLTTADYTAVYSKNTLPGTATLKVTGKGNYTGTLTATFTIDRATITGGMYSVTMPADALYDGTSHTATVSKSEDLGAATLTYRVNNVEQEPIDGGNYDVYLSIAGSSLYYGMAATKVGSFTIWRMDAEEWTALQAIYAELSAGTWANPWDMSKGEAGAGTFAGLTFNQGHIVALNLSNNGLDGNFPLSTLTLPYLTNLNLSYNNLSGNIETGVTEYLASQMNPAPARANGDAETITVRVRKPAGWSSVYVYAWGAENLGVWPGLLMTDEGDGWWSYSNLSVGVNLVFSDNGKPQTEDILNVQVSTEYILQEGSPYSVASATEFDPSSLTLPKGVQVLNISHNELEGNIGLFAQALPKLVSLDASYNHISEVVPMLSTSITQLNLNYEEVLGTRVIDLPAIAEDFSELVNVIPTVMLYNHTDQSYVPASNTLVTVKDDPNNLTFSVGAVVTSYAQKQWSWVSGDNYNVFRYTSDDALIVTQLNTTHSRFTATINFNAGDANFTGTTDVLDLQAMINFIFGEYTTERPFNYTAANLFKDGVINVQDVVLMTELLLTEENPQTVGVRRMPEEETETEAELRWENGELHLTSEKAVAAMDLTITADAAIEWIIPTHDVVTKQTTDGQHAVVYSLAGNTLAAGKDIVIARSADLAPVTVAAKLADKEAQPVTVRMRTVGAKIPTGIDNAQESDVQSTKVIRDGVLYIERGGKMYDATGRLIIK